MSCKNALILENLCEFEIAKYRPSIQFLLGIPVRLEVVPVDKQGLMIASIRNLQIMYTRGFLSGYAITFSPVGFEWECLYKTTIHALAVWLGGNKIADIPLNWTGYTLNVSASTLYNELLKRVDFKCDNL